MNRRRVLDGLGADLDLARSIDGPLTMLQRFPSEALKSIC
jgi:hypothetical protein